jgi:hypothetical protein
MRKWIRRHIISSDDLDRALNASYRHVVFETHPAEAEQIRRELDDITTRVPDIMTTMPRHQKIRMREFRWDRLLWPVLFIAQLLLIPYLSLLRGGGSQNRSSHYMQQTLRVMLHVMGTMASRLMVPIVLLPVFLATLIAIRRCPSLRRDLHRFIHLVSRPWRAFIAAKKNA